MKLGVCLRGALIPGNGGMPRHVDVGVYHILHVDVHHALFNKSADPGLGQGRGGAWDHRRCGTSPSSLSKVKPISQPASCPKATSRQHFPGMLRPPVKTSRHLDMKITCFGKPLKRWLGMLHPAANSHPEATHQWLLMGRLRAFGHENNMLWETLKTLTWHASSCSQQPPQGHTSMASYGPLKQSLGMLHPAANRHPKATHQWLLMGFQACRLAALKRLKPSKPLKTLKPLKRLLGMLHPAANSHPKATINGFLWAA